MISQRIVPAFILILGLFIILIPTYIFPICDHSNQAMTTKNNISHTHNEHHNHHNEHATVKVNQSKCYYSAKAEVGIGAIILLIGLFIFFIKSAKIKLGLSLSLLAISGLSAAIPTILIGVCSSNTMICKIATLPALLFVSVLLFITNIFHVLYLSKQKN